MLSARAAAENDPASTTRTKACIAASRSMLIPSRNGDYRHTASAASLALRSPYRSRRRPAVRATSEDPMTLQAKLDAFKADFEAGKPSGPRAAGRLGHMPRPEEIAAAMLFLASEDSSFVAGSELLVDGGMCSV